MTENKENAPLTISQELNVNVSFVLQSEKPRVAGVMNQWHSLNVQNIGSQTSTLWILSTTFTNMHILVKGFNVHIENSTFVNTVFTLDSFSFLLYFTICNSQFVSEVTLKGVWSHFSISGRWSSVSLRNSTFTSSSTLHNSLFVFSDTTVSRVELCFVVFSELVSLVQCKRESSLHLIHLGSSVVTNNLYFLSLRNCKNKFLEIRGCKIAGTGQEWLLDKQNMSCSSVVQASNISVTIANSSFLNNQFSAKLCGTSLLACHNCAVVIENSDFENNSADEVQALFSLFGGDVLIKSSSFLRNEGGCFHFVNTQTQMYQTAVKVLNCIFF